MTKDELAEFLFTTSKEIIETGREAMPILALWRTGDVDKPGLQIVGMPWHNDLQKEAMVRETRKMLAADHSITLYGLVSEVWTIKVDLPGLARLELKHMPRDDPSRQEALMVTAYSRDGAGLTLCADIKTSDGVRRVMAPDKTFDERTNAHGQMVNFFMPPPVEN